MDPLKAFERWFCIAFVFALFYIALLWLVIRRRDLWLRYTAAEAAFWLRIGFPPARIVNACRRWEEGGSFVYWIGAILFATVLVMVVGGVLYFKVKHLR
jgi:hypothetical protein